MTDKDSKQDPNKIQDLEPSKQVERQTTTTSTTSTGSNIEGVSTSAPTGQATTETAPSSDPVAVEEGEKKALVEANEVTGDLLQEVRDEVAREAATATEVEKTGGGHEEGQRLQQWGEWAVE